MLSRSFLTNFISIVLIVISFFLPSLYSKYFLYAGLFALSGAVTNQLAIHMLFEKVPFLYGSGIIVLHFEDFKRSIKNLMMREFFTKEQLNTFFQDEESNLDLVPIVKNTDFSPTFDTLKTVVMESSLGKMLAMFGSDTALEGLREPFNKNMKKVVIGIIKTDAFKENIRQYTKNSSLSSDMLVKIEAIVDDRLNKITPTMVKEIIFHLMSSHLDWLVVWGGFFGGLIGVLSSFVLK